MKLLGKLPPRSVYKPPMKSVSKICVGMAALLLAGAAFAQSAPAFMIIRFNQPRMYFDQQMYGAVAKAVSIKPDVMFEMVAHSPATGNPERDAQWKLTSEQHLALVTSRMNAIGVPTSRIRTSVRPQSGLSADEVHLFAY